MGKGRVLSRLALIGSAIAGVVFFWRKRQGTGYTADDPGGASGERVE